MTTNELILALALATLIVVVLFAVWQIPRTWQARRDNEHSALATAAASKGMRKSRALRARREPSLSTPVTEPAGQ